MYKVYLYKTVLDFDGELPCDEIEFDVKADCEDFAQNSQFVGYWVTFYNDGMYQYSLLPE